jgi:hypothetical protein
LLVIKLLKPAKSLAYAGVLRVKKSDRIETMIALIVLSLLLAPAYGHQVGWSAETSTYYTGITDLFGGWQGNCGYGDLSRKLGTLSAVTYGTLFAAGSSLIYQAGAGCGDCFEIQCIGSPVCSGKAITVTIIDNCPYQGNEQWCGPSAHHFDLSGYAFNELVNTMAVGHVAIQWRRVQCVQNNGIVVPVLGNPYWQSIIAMNVAGAGGYDSLLVRGAKASSYTALAHDWGSNFVHSGQLAAPVSLKLVDALTASIVELVDCILPGWRSGDLVTCKGNFRS